MSFGNRLKKAREAKGLTQIEVMNITGIGNKTISDYENGRTQPDPGVINVFCDLYEVDPNYLLGRTDEPGLQKAELVIPDELKNVKVALHGGTFEGLHQDEVDKLAEYVKFLKSQRKEE